MSVSRNLHHMLEAIRRVEGFSSPKIDLWRVTIEDMISDGDYTTAEMYIATNAMHTHANAAGVPVLAPTPAESRRMAEAADRFHAAGYGLRTLGRAAIIG